MKNKGAIILKTDDKKGYRSIYPNDPEFDQLKQMIPMSQTIIIAPAVEEFLPYRFGIFGDIIQVAQQALVNSNVSVPVLIKPILVDECFIKYNSIDNALFRMMIFRVTDRTGINWYEDLIKFLRDSPSPTHKGIYAINNDINGWPIASDRLADEDVMLEIEYAERRYGRYSGEKVFSSVISVRYDLSPFQQANMLQQMEKAFLSLTPENLKASRVAANLIKLRDYSVASINAPDASTLHRQAFARNAFFSKQDEEKESGESKGLTRSRSFNQFTS